MLTEKEVLERAFRALDELVGRRGAGPTQGNQSESYTSRRCISESSNYSEIQYTSELAAGRLNSLDKKHVEVALRWYCSTCGVDGVIWHLPEVTCDAKECVITRAHGERASGCRRLDYRVVSDSETRPWGEHDYRRNIVQTGQRAKTNLRTCSRRPNVTT